MLLAAAFILTSLFPLKLWKPKLVVHCAIWGVGHVCQLFGMHPMLLPAAYTVGNVTFYMWHRLAHELPGAMRDIHLLHHVRDFPAHDFFGVRTEAIRKLYGSPPKTMIGMVCRHLGSKIRLQHEGVLLAMLLGPCYLSPLTIRAKIAVTTLYLATSIMNAALHMAMHVRGFSWERYAWFREMRALHAVHHQHDANFALIECGIDSAFGTCSSTP